MGKLLIYRGILKTTPTKHLEPGTRHWHAKAQEENTQCHLHSAQLHLFSRISARDDCTDSQDKAEQDAGVLSTHQGARRTRSSRWQLSGEMQPSQVLQGQNETSARPRIKLV